MINDTEIKVKQNQMGNYRGLHLVLINPENGEVEFAQVFDTYRDNQSLANFILQAKRIPRGRIVIAACKDDCATKLAWNSRKWFADMGSEEIWNLEYRQGFAFIGVKGEILGCHEKRAVKETEQVLVTQIFVKGDKASQDIFKSNLEVKMETTPKTPIYNAKTLVKIQKVEKKQKVFENKLEILRKKEENLRKNRLKT